MEQGRRNISNVLYHQSRQEREMSVGELEAREERPPYVRFERRGIEDKQASLKAGHYVARDVDYALITPPYSRDRVDIKVDNWFKNEEKNVKSGHTPIEWLERWKKGYEAWKQGEEMEPDGTPIKGWGALSPAQEKMVLHSGIRTIEDLASCNDEGLRRLGLGGRDLVTKARAWLQSANDHGKVALQNAALVKENEQLKTTVASLEEKVDRLAKMVEGKSAVVSREEPSLSDILPNDNINPVNSGTGDNNVSMQQVWRDTSADRSTILPGVSREIYEREPQETLRANNLSEETSKLQGVRERLQEKGETDQISMREVRGRQESDAPQGLQQATRGGLVVQDMSPKAAREAYEQKFGKPPHHRMKEETIRAKLEE
jgi:hypothetical protein